MRCTWEGCSCEASKPLVLKISGPVLAELCESHYQELMEAPKNSMSLAEGMETIGQKLRKAIHNMPVRMHGAPP